MSWILFGVGVIMLLVSFLADEKVTRAYMRGVASGFFFTSLFISI